MNYAIYIIVVEDTEDAFMDIGTMGASSVESVLAIETEAEAIDLATKAREAIS